MSNNKVLVTGSTGMLGSNIVRCLLQEGYEVKCLVQPGVSVKTLRGLDVEFANGDLLDPGTLSDPFRGCGYIINAAACTNIWPYRSEKVCKTNYQGVINLAEHARAAGIDRFIHIGSASSFGHGSRENPGTEESAFTGWQFGLDYINSKYLSQKYLLGLHAMHGFPVVIVNPTYMIGPYDSGPTSGRLLLNYYLGKLPGYTAGGRNFVHAGDVARAAVRSLTSGATGECYIAGGENLSYREFFEISSMVTGRPFRMKRMPAALTSAYAACASAIARLTGKAPSVSLAVARLSRETQFYSSAKLEGALSLSPTPVQFAIDSCMQWFKQNGYA
jgi:dihydroflavonol-4-reductase